VTATGPRLLNDAYEMVSAADLQPHPDNPNRGQVAEIEASIETNGWFGAILAQRSSGRIVAGEHRWRAAVNAGWAELPVIWLDVDDDRARRILLADNRFATLAKWDPTALVDLLDDLSVDADGLAGTGFSQEELARLVARAAPPDDFPEVDESLPVEYRCPRCHYVWSGKTG
jgi:ParB-like chromosome segregation protein Spo0J